MPSATTSFACLAPPTIPSRPRLRRPSAGRTSRRRICRSSPASRRLSARSRPSIPHAFLGGAKAAYETIVTAFARGDRKTLKGLLAKEVYEGFEQAITDREKRGEKAESSFVSIDKAEITGVDVKGKTGQVTIAFVSQLISVTRDAAGQCRRRQRRGGLRGQRHLDLLAPARQPRSQLAARSRPKPRRDPWRRFRTGAARGCLRRAGERHGRLASTLAARRAAPRPCRRRSLPAGRLTIIASPSASSREGCMADPPLRPAVALPKALASVCAEAQRLLVKAGPVDRDQARRFFEQRFSLLAHPPGAFRDRLHDRLFRARVRGLD